uniref:Protein inscuteable homolog n=1 Tax=Cacopsylla melanoneura TaxID=428564 RepID=A0A8D9AB09_9HEMI
MMGEFHRTYSKVWWPNLELEDTLSPSSSPSSNGSHRSQDSGFSQDSDTSTSKQTSEQHLRNFAHTPENQIHSSPEPCENIEESDEHEDIILPESQYSETPMRVKKSATKGNSQQEKGRQILSCDQNHLTPDRSGTSLNRHSTQYDVEYSRQNQSGRRTNQKLNCSEPLQNYKSIESEKQSYLRKRDNRKSLGSMKNPDKKSTESRKNRHSLSLNLVNNQNEENVNPRLYQSYSEQKHQPYQRQNSAPCQSRSNEFFRETFNFQPYKNESVSSVTTPRLVDSKPRESYHGEFNRTRSPLPNQKTFSNHSHNITAGNLPHPSDSPDVHYARVYHNHTMPEVKTAPTTEPLIQRPSSGSKSAIIDSRNQSTTERNSIMLQNLNPAERQLLENLTANYLSKSTCLEKDESIYENLERNLVSKVIDKVQKSGSKSLQETNERNSVSLNITSTAFNQTVDPILNHTVDRHDYNTSDIFDPRNNLQRYHTYSQICDQDSNCFIKKWDVSDSSVSQSNILDNSAASMHDSRFSVNNLSQCTTQLTQDSTYSEYSSNLTAASYLLPEYSTYCSANCSTSQRNPETTRNGPEVINESWKSNHPRSPPSTTRHTSSQQNNVNQYGCPVPTTVNFSEQSSLENSMLSESINSVLSRHRSKSNEAIDISPSKKVQNSSYTGQQPDQRTFVQNQNQTPVEESTSVPMAQVPHQSNTSSPLGNSEFSKLKLRRRSRNESNNERTRRSRSLARVNRHSTAFEIDQQEESNHIRRCKSLSNLEANQSTTFSEEQPIEELPELRGGKSFLQSNLDLIEPPHFTSTPKKPPRSLEIHRRCPPPPEILRKTPDIREPEQDETISRSTDPPVSHWLRELSQRYDAEYMTALQSKALISERLGESQILSGPASKYIVTLQEKIRTISSEFTKLLRQIEKFKWDLIGPLSQSLLGHIEQFLSDYQVSSPLMRTECDALRGEAFREPPTGDKLKTRISSLGKSFATVVDTILFDQIKHLLSTLDKDRTPSVVLSTLSSLTKLGLDSAHLGNLVARYPGGGMRTIVSVLLDVPCIHVTVCALRTITLLCSSVQCIRHLEKCNGIEILADILSDETRDETVLSEAISVLTQVTAPWLDTNQHVADLTRHVDTFVASLTRLMRKQLNSETLLLISAALANLSFMEPKAVWSLQQHNSIGILLTAVRKLATRASVFLQEQTATLIANMAAVPEVRPSLAQARAVVALLCFLQTRASPLQRAPEILAAERLQHKSAIALSRLCSDVEIAQQVVELQGVTRLVKLCKEERERNHSDGVLVACLVSIVMGC